MKVLEIDDPKTQQFLQKIGRAIVEFNFLEMFVELLLWQVIAAKKGNNGDDEQSVGRRITINLTFMQKGDLLRSLVVERKGEEFTKKFTDEIYKKLHFLAEKRDDIAHSLWYIQYGSSSKDLSTEKLNFLKAYERGKSFKFEKAKKTVSSQELDDFIKLIDDVTSYILHYGVNKL